MIRVSVDADNVLARTFTDLEREQLPFALRNATNKVAFELRDQWKTTAQRVFDRPRALTINAVLVNKAVKGQREYAEVFIRDEAHKGTPPAKYLLPNVEGGPRPVKPLERLLRQRGILPAGEFVVPGKGAELDAHGNIRASQITQILSQLGAQNDPLQNATPASNARRSKKRRRGGEYFAPRRNDPNRYRHAHLPLGVYERIQTGFGSALRSVLHFVRQATYKPRYPIFDIAERQWNKLMPFHFNRELEKAVQTAVTRSGSRR